MNNNQVNLNIEDLKSFMNHIISNNRFLQASGKKPVAVEVIGDSGIGKTSSILQLANETGLNCVKLNLAQIEELGDLVGFPVRQFQLSKEGSIQVAPAVKKVSAPTTRMVKKVVKKMITELETQMVEEFDVQISKKQVLENGKFVTKEVETKIAKMVPKEVEVEREVEEEVEVIETVDEIVSVIEEPSAEEGDYLWIDEQAIDEYVKRGYKFTGKKRMSYCPPEWIADKQGGGILILDDWNRADVRFIQAVMELVDRQEYISWKLPKDWHIVLTANPDNGDYLINSIDTAQRTRFISVNLKFDMEVWGTWAENDQIDTRCINFMLMHPELVTHNTNARSIVNFYNSISSIKDFENNLPLIQNIGEGSVGTEFTTMFTSFIHNKLDKLIEPKEILLGDNNKTISDKLMSSIGSGDNYRADIAAIMATRIINYSLFYAEKNSITQKIIDRITFLVTEPDLFTNDLKYHMVKKILNGNKQKFQKIMVNPEVIKMAVK